MTDPFYRAFIPETKTVLGFKLRPLSVGHVILLHRIESPFVVEGDPSLSDLASACLICSLSYQEALESITDPEIDRFMRRWHDKLTGCNWLVRLRLKKPKLLDVASEMLAFSEYLKEHSRFPKYSYSPTDFKEMECPSAQVVKVSLMRDLKFTEAEILDRSWLVCIWDFVTLKALAGHVRMYSEGGKFESALEDAQKVAEALAQALAKRNGGAICQ